MSYLIIIGFAILIVINAILTFMLYQLINALGEVVVTMYEKNNNFLMQTRKIIDKNNELYLNLKKLQSLPKNIKSSIRMLDKHINGIDTLTAKTKKRIGQ